MYRNIIQTLNLLTGGNPQQMADRLMHSNPQFKKFVDENKALTPQQICQKFGVDPSVLNFIK